MKVNTSTQMSIPELTALCHKHMLQPPPVYVISADFNFLRQDIEPLPLSDSDLHFRDYYRSDLYGIPAFKYRSFGSTLQAIYSDTEKESVKERKEPIPYGSSFGVLITAVAIAAVIVFMAISGS